MKKLSILLAIVCVFIISRAVFAQEFSADMSNTAAGRTFQGKIFVTKDKVRMDTPEAITISRIDKKVVWMIMPSQQMYMEQSFNPANIPATADKMSGEIERKFLGTETVDGKPADKYRVTYEVEGRRNTVLQWIAKGFKIPVKSAAEDGSWVVEYRNIKIGSQPESLFEIPAGYKKFSYGMGALEDMLQ